MQATLTSQPRTVDGPYDQFVNELSEALPAHVKSGDRAIVLEIAAEAYARDISFPGSAEHFNNYRMALSEAAEYSGLLRVLKCVQTASENALTPRQIRDINRTILDSDPFRVKFQELSDRELGNLILPGNPDYVTQVNFLCQYSDRLSLSKTHAYLHAIFNGDKNVNTSRAFISKVLELTAQADSAQGFDSSYMNEFYPSRSLIAISSKLLEYATDRNKVRDRIIALVEKYGPEQAYYSLSSVSLNSKGPVTPESVQIEGEAFANFFKSVSEKADGVTLKGSAKVVHEAIQCLPRGVTVEDISAASQFIPSLFSEFVERQQSTKSSSLVIRNAQSLIPFQVANEALLQLGEATNICQKLANSNAKTGGVYTVSVFQEFLTRMLPADAIETYGQVLKDAGGESDLQVTRIFAILQNNFRELLTPTQAEKISNVFCNSDPDNRSRLLNVLTTAVFNPEVKTWDNLASTLTTLEA